MEIRSYNLENGKGNSNTKLLVYEEMLIANESQELLLKFVEYRVKEQLDK